jgi:hypothetical protein
VPDLQIGAVLCELKGMRSNHRRPYYSGAQVTGITGVEKRGVK